MLIQLPEDDLLYVLAGWYWIDPSQGSMDDAMHVFCNMTGDTVETCIYPTSRTKMVMSLPFTGLLSLCVCICVCVCVCVCV